MLLQGLRQPWQPVGYAIDKAGGYTSGYLVMIAYCVLGLLCILPFLGRKSAGQPQAGEIETSLAESK